jgi:hypothetical protein
VFEPKRIYEVSFAAAPNQRLKLTPRRLVVLDFSVARRSLSAIR